MTDYLKTALLLEEKAEKLSRNSLQRANLLALAKACRLVGIEIWADWEEPQTPGLYARKAQACEQTAQSLPDGHPEKQKLLEEAERQHLRSASAWLRPLTSRDLKAA